MIRELERLEVLNSRIDNLCDEYERLRARIVSASGATYTGDTGTQTDIDAAKRRQDARLAKLSDLSIQIDHMVDNYTDKRIELLEWITNNEVGLTTLEVAVVIARCFDFKRFEEIALSLRVSRSTVYSAFSSARTKIEPIHYVPKETEEPRKVEKS